jgi:anaerobic magnesium-protoporphyrin IX monomethyl ester cyclase
MKILLIHPPSPFLLDDKALIPLGAVLIGTTLNQAGHHAEVLDLAGDPNFVQTAVKRVAEGWDAIGISTTTQQTGKVVPIIRALRGEWPALHLVAGGAGPTNDADLYLRIGFDKVVRNEGEYAFDAWKPGGERIVTPPLLDDLDKLPFADRDLVDVKNYRFLFRDRAGDLRRATHIMSTRGCPMSCSFCSGRLTPFYRSYREMSPERVVAELEFIREKWGFSAVTDYADEINVSKTWLHHYADVLEGRGFALRSFCIARNIDEGVMRDLARGGWTEICIGVEDGNDEVLARNHIFKTNRKTTVRACQLAHKYGVRIKMFTMVGLPGETRETAMDTKSLLLEARPDDFDVTIHTPFPGSPIYEKPQDFAWGLSFRPVDFASEELGFYKTYEGNYKAYARTPTLSEQDLVALRDEIDRDVRAELGMQRMTRENWQATLEHAMGQGQG